MKPLLFALLLLAGSAVAQEDKLIAVLESDAPLKDRADACEELARVGTGHAVPVLASLLADEQLSHRARSALEAIADPSVDVALRQALGRLNGELLVGAIHSLGVRKDAQAVEPLARLLAASDPAVAQAAARALGRIGRASVQALEGALSASSLAIQPAIGEGLLRCAGTLPGPEAAALYDKLRSLPNLPYHLRLAAWSGAVRSRGAQGVPLMVEAIRTGSPVPAADALRVSMDLTGAEVTRALVGALTEANEETQVLLLRTLGLRGDAPAVPALVALAQSGSVSRRIAAIQSLVQLANPSSLPALAALLKDPDAAVAGAALTGLSGWPGQEADATVVALLTGSDTKTRIAALGAVAQRRNTTALPALLQAAGDADAGVAGSAFKALGELGGAAEIPGVVSALLETKALTAAESALVAIGERQADPAICAESVLSGLARARGEAQLALLRVLGTLGGSRALDALRAAAASSDEAVRETAYQTLCDWPTADALADLARMTRTTADPRMKRLAVRGQLRLIPLQSVTAAQQVAQIGELLSTIEQVKEQPLALSTLGGLHCAESLALVLPFLRREGLEAEAGIAAVAIAETIVGSHPAEVAEAMKQIQTPNEQLAERVRQVLAKVPADATEAGFRCTPDRR